MSAPTCMFVFTIYSIFANAQIHLNANMNKVDMKPAGQPEQAGFGE